MGTFTHAPTRLDAPRDVDRRLDGDTVWPGMGHRSRPAAACALYDTMRKAGADVFIHPGDTIYADEPLQAEVKLDDGRIWRNLVTAGEEQGRRRRSTSSAATIATTCSTSNVRRFNAVAVAVRDLGRSRSAAQLVSDADPRIATRATREKSVALLAARAKRAFLEYHADAPRSGAIRSASIARMPVRSARRDLRLRHAQLSRRQLAEPADGADRRRPRILGAAQVAWLKQRLQASTATWKVIASDMPLGLVVRDGPSDFEAVANGDAGPPLGRELEIADLLTFIRDQQHPQRRLRHRRRALLRRAPLRSGARARSRTSIRSGSSSPAPRTPARSARTCSTRPSARRRGSSASRRG